VNPRDQAARDAILARLAESRAEIRRLLEPPPEGARGAHADPSGAPGGFPRSRTMRMLMSGKGIGAMGATAAGLFVARPGLAFKLIRALPIARLILSRVLGGRARRKP
jgi:hypothetical protein